MLEDVDDGNELGCRLEAYSLATLSHLLEHRVLSIIHLTTFDAGQVKVQHPTMG